MKKVAVVQMVYNGMKYIPKSFSSIFNQTYPNIQVVAVINGNDDGGREYIEKHFPKTVLIDKGQNLKFAKGHNLVFETVEADYYQLVNQDLILEPDYIERMLEAFKDDRVGAANGKIYEYDFANGQKSNRLDTTGIVVSRSGRGRSRGQHEIDNRQYDRDLKLISVDGAACMYRREALRDVRYEKELGEFEYFDESFEMYWEDVDLGFRLTNAGWNCVYVPNAIGYHGRSAAASPGGYLKLWSFIKHHRSLPLWLRRYNYVNHILMFVKNTPRWYVRFFIRELAYHAYLLLFETRVLSAVFTLFKKLPQSLRKRRFIQSKKALDIVRIEKLLV